MSTTNTNTVGGLKTAEELLSSLIGKAEGCNDEPDAVSWGMEEGILLSKRDVESIIFLLTHQQNINQSSVDGDNVASPSNSGDASVVSLPCTSGNSIQQLKAALNLAQAELRSCYQRLGYTSSNVLRSIDEALDLNLSLTPIEHDATGTVAIEFAKWIDRVWCGNDTGLPPTFIDDNYKEYTTEDLFEMFIGPKS